MQAAECDKRAIKIAPLGADSAVGNDFASSKKEAPPSKSPPTFKDAVAQRTFFRSWKKEAPPSPGQRPVVSVNVPQSPFQVRTPYQRPMFSSACGVSDSYDGKVLFYVPTPHPLRDTQGSLIGRANTNSPLSSDSFQVANHPCQSWLLNSSVKLEVTSSSDLPLLELVGVGATATRMDMFGAVLTLHNYKSYYNHLQHLYLHDTNKSMLPGQGGEPSTAALVNPVPPHLFSPPSKRRYSYRTKCDCPNCSETEKLGPDGARLRKKNIHNCHFPGCDKMYNRPNRLQAHLRLHTGDRPFVCIEQFCGKRFCSNERLKRHLKNHRGEKTFACQLCSKRFVRSDVLSLHMESHNGNGEDRKNSFSSASCSDSENSQLEQPSPGSSSLYVT